MSAAMILLYGVVAKAGIDLLQLGLIGWGLRRWGARHRQAPRGE